MTVPVTLWNIEVALGNGHKVPALSEMKNRNIARKSLFAAMPVSKGEIFSASNLTMKRPGNGVSPMKYWELIGEEAKKNYDEDEQI